MKSNRCETWSVVSLTSKLQQDSANFQNVSRTFRTLLVWLISESQARQHKQYPFSKSEDQYIRYYNTD